MVSQGHALCARQRHECPSYDSSASDPVRSPTSPDSLRRSRSPTLSWARSPSFPNKWATTPYRRRTFKNCHTCQLARIRPDDHSGDAPPQTTSTTITEMVPKGEVLSKLLVVTVIEARARHLQSLAIPQLRRRNPFVYSPQAFTDILNLCVA